MAAPLLPTAALGSLASQSGIAIITSNIAPSLASAGLRLSTAHSSSSTSRNSYSSPLSRRSIHTAQGKRYTQTLYQSAASPLLISRDGVPRVRTTSASLPLDQRANFWHRSCRPGNSPYGDASAFKTASNAARMRTVEEQWARNVEKMNEVHEMMRKRHMDFMKRRLETDPYDVLFGWRNRLRAGLPQQMWVRGSDVLEAKQPSSEAATQAESDASTIQQAGTSESTASVAREASEQPIVQSSISSYEYDPIANRMVHKQADVIGHLPAESPAGAESRQPYKSAAQQDADAVRVEFEKWKAAKFSQSADPVAEPAQAHTQAARPANESPSMSKIASRARLEDSFQQVHRQAAQDVVPEDFSRRLRKSNQYGDEILPQSEGVMTAKSSAQYDAVLESLAARIQNVGDRVERLQQRSSAILSAKPETASRQQSDEEQLRQNFRDFRKLTGSFPESSPQQAEQPQKPVSFRQLKADDAAETMATNAQKTSTQHVYEILAYDPLTSEVNTTTVSAPEAAKEQVLGLSEALSRLAEPAKFLPHLRHLKDRGFEPVTATKNMLVLRGVPADAAAASSSAAAADNAASTSSASNFGGGRFGGYYNNNNNPEAVERLRARRWRRRRRFVRALFWWPVMFAGIWFVFAGTAAFIRGVVSGHRSRRHGQSSTSDNLPQTEEEMYRAMREGNKPPRREFYPGMRRVTYPKEKEG